MTPDQLYESVAHLVERVLGDPRWATECDDLGIEVLGMLLYGFALATGRSLLLLDIEEIDDVVTRCLVEQVGVAAKWSGGLVAAASRSAFDQTHHPAYFELIGVGHGYLCAEHIKVVDNIYANIARMR